MIHYGVDVSSKSYLKAHSKCIQEAVGKHMELSMLPKMAASI